MAMNYGNYGMTDYTNNPNNGLFGDILQGLNNAGGSALAQQAANNAYGLGDYTTQGFMGDVASSGVASTPAATSNSWWDSMLGTTNPDGTKTNGWGSLALGLAQGAFGAYNSMKTYGLARDQLAESKRQFNANYNTQRSLLNTQMSDRQAARVASNPTAYQSVGDYMSKNGV